MMDGLLEPIENMEALDRLAEVVAGVVAKVAPAGAVKDLLSGTRIGHPRIRP